MAISERAQKVFDFLKERGDSGIPPTVREICNSLGIKSTSSVHHDLNILEQNGLIERDSQNARAIYIKGFTKSVQVPIIGRVTAGLPILAVEEVEGYLPFDNRHINPKDLFALRVQGMSMKNAGIMDGDLVVCKRQTTADDGEIVVALIEDEATVKRIYREKFGVRLQPENEDFDPIYAAEVLVLGKVVSCVRFYN